MASPTTGFNTQTFLHTLSCPVNFTPLTDAVNLLPCNHVIGQVAATRMYGKIESGSGRCSIRGIACPICRATISTYAPSLAIRELASQVFANESPAVAVERLNEDEAVVAARREFVEAELERREAGIPNVPTTPQQSGGPHRILLAVPSQFGRREFERYLTNLFPTLGRPDFEFPRMPLHQNPIDHRMAEDLGLGDPGLNPYTEATLHTQGIFNRVPLRLPREPVYQNSDERRELLMRLRRERQAETRLAAQRSDARVQQLAFCIFFVIYQASLNRNMSSGI